MTLHLGTSTNQFAVLVSDRRTTRASGAVFDELANKVVILCTVDGLFAIGYAGDAFIAGKPTDQWIAEVLADEVAEQFGDSTPDSQPRHAALDQTISAATGRLRGMLQVERDSTGIEVQVLGVGVFMSNAGPAPAGFVIALDPSGNTYERRIIQHNPAVAQTVIHRIPASSAGPANDLKDLHDEIAGARHDRTVDILVAAIRSAAGDDEGIGADCSSVEIHPDGTALVRFHSAGATPAPNNEAGRAGATNFTYVPTIVGLNGILWTAPLITGGTVYRFGPFTITVEASPGDNGGVLLSTDPGKRKRP